MAEKYGGRKFRTIFKGSEAPEDSRITEAMMWGQKFHAMGLLPVEDGGHAGNISFRNDRGFVITAGGKDKGKLNQADFVQVLSCNIDNGTVTAEGEAEPSSETLAHCMLYERRKDIDAIIHVHDPLVLSCVGKLGIKATAHIHSYGTPELAREIVASVGKRNFLAVKGHGVIALGKSLWEAGKIIEAYHSAAGHLCELPEKE
ncbi:MAG: class II aldolase/adducin family protein [Candidatus Aenigmatarchaeota archaeon]